MLVKVLAQVKTDNSGLLIEVPVLLSEYGVFDPLLDYVISQSHIKSLPWMNRITFACQLFLEYMEANTGLFSDASKLFQSFVMRLSLGTISPEGNDPSGLYWLPRSTANVNQLLSALNGLTDWLTNNRNTTSLNPVDQTLVLQELCTSATTRTTNALTVLNAVLEQQSRITPLDFSMATIGRLSKEQGGPSTQTIRNRTGKHFQQLIEAWAAYAGTSCKKPLSVRQKQLLNSNDQHILDAIDDPVIRAVVGSLIAERNKYRDQLNTLKAAISDAFFNKQGWEVMPTGQVKDAEGNEIYKRGYVNGLRKMLP